AIRRDGIAANTSSKGWGTAVSATLREIYSRRAHRVPPTPERLPTTGSPTTSAPIPTAASAGGAMPRAGAPSRRGLPRSTAPLRVPWLKWFRTACATSPLTTLEQSLNISGPLNRSEHLSLQVRSSRARLRPASRTGNRYMKEYVQTATTSTAQG